MSLQLDTIYFENFQTRKTCRILGLRWPSLLCQMSEFAASPPIALNVTCFHPRHKDFLFYALLLGHISPDS